MLSSTTQLLLPLIPINWNPKEIAQLAKAASIAYVVSTF